MFLLFGIASKKAINWKYSMKLLRVDSDELRQDLVPIIASTIIIAIIIIVYNIFKYTTIEVPESIPDNAVQLTSASVVISGRPNLNNSDAIEIKNVCVLSKSKYITNDTAIKVALGESQNRYTAQNYRINVIRPCSKQEPSYASEPAITLLKA